MLPEGTDPYGNAVGSGASMIDTSMLAARYELSPLPNLGEATYTNAGTLPPRLDPYARVPRFQV